MNIVIAPVMWRNMLKKGGSFLEKNIISLLETVFHY